MGKRDSAEKANPAVRLLMVYLKPISLMLYTSLRFWIIDRNVQWPWKSQTTRNIQCRDTISENSYTAAMLRLGGIDFFEISISKMRILWCAFVNNAMTPPTSPKKEDCVSEYGEMQVFGCLAIMVRVWLCSEWIYFPSFHVCQRPFDLGRRFAPWRTEACSKCLFEMIGWIVIKKSCKEESEQSLVKSRNFKLSLEYCLYFSLFEQFPEGR